MGDNTREMCHQQAHGTADLLTKVWDAIDAGEDYEDEDAREYLDSWPLEIVWEKGEPFAVVLGTGGPHVEIRGGTRHDGQSYAIHVYWAGEHVEYGHSVDSVQRTGEYFREIAEG